jgi:hypothetical protein
MRLHTPPLVPHESLAAMLAWLAGFLAWWAQTIAALSGPGPKRMQRKLAALLDPSAILLAQVIFLRAFARLRRGNFADKQNPLIARCRPALLRAILGSGLRRALRGASFRARLHGLRQIVHDSETHIASLARRLARGLTRRASFALAPLMVVGGLGAGCAPAPSVDTS